MDRKPFNPETDPWVDERLASLAPAPDWTPNTHRALNQILRGQKPAGPRWMSLGMTATILATTVLVLALLPWQRLWTPDQTQKSAASAVTQVEKQQTTPQAPPTAAEQTEAAKVEEVGRGQLQHVLSPPEQAEAEKFRLMQELEAKTKADDEKAAELFKRMQDEAATAAGAAQSSGFMPPTLVSQVLPEYADEARKARIVGTVEMIVTIQTDGSVQFESVKSGLGYGLDEKAREAVEKWHFTPGMKDGVPVRTMISVTVRFSLR